MADLKIKISAVTDGLKKGISDAGAKLSGFASKVKNSFRESAAAITAVSASIVGLITQSTKAAARLETVQASFTTMLGNAAEATKLVDQLRDFSKKTPFTPEQVFAAARTLMAFGQTTQEVNSTVKMLGDISAATGKDLNELARIFGKVFVKGKIQAEELNQFSEAGIPIIKELQKQFGITASEVFKLGSSGKLTFKDMNEALKSMTKEGGIFFNAMITQSETLNGKISTLGGAWDDFLSTVGNTALAKKGIDFLTKALDTYSQTIKNHEKTIKGVNVGASTIGAAVSEMTGIDAAAEFFGITTPGQKLTEHAAPDRGQIVKNRRKVALQRREEFWRRKKASDEADIRIEDAWKKAREDVRTKLQGRSARLAPMPSDALLNIGGALTPVGDMSTMTVVSELQNQTGYLKMIEERLRELTTEEDRQISTYTFDRSGN
jgi:tape measure domain-containing protein